MTVDGPPTAAGRMARFAQVRERDAAAGLLDDEDLTRWLLVDPAHAAAVGDDPGVTGYDGPGHLRRWFAWAAAFDLPDYLLAEDHPLVALAAARDAACLDRLGVPHDDLDLAHVARYDAQDHVLARAYPVPDRQRPRVVLDLGPGHGRLANLAFAPGEPTDLLVSVEAIAGPYLTQRDYYEGLGLRVADYLDNDDPHALDVAARAADHDVVHLPTWRLDLVPDASVDLVCAVQVLKELPTAAVWFVLAHLRRVVRPGGALYVRDHLHDHDLTRLPVDDLVAHHGFVLEWAPHVRDRADLHGVPRVWRRLDPAAVGGGR